MARLRYVDLSGTIGSGNLTNVATTHTFTAPLKYVDGGITVPTLAGSDYFMLSILNAAGTAVSEVVKVTAYNSGTGAATIVRGQAGTAGVAHTSADKVLLAAYPDDFDSGILAVVVYGPGSSAAINTTSATHADVDATNLAITFTAPPSGKVLVTLHGWVGLMGSATVYAWGLRESTTVVGDVALAYQGGSMQYRTSAMFYITGLTPGSSHTYKWAHRCWSGSASSGMVVQLTNEATLLVQAVA